VASHRAITSLTIGHQSITLRQDPDFCIHRPAAVKENTRAARGQIRIRVIVIAVIAAPLKIAPRKAVDMTYLTTFTIYFQR